MSTPDLQAQLAAAQAKLAVDQSSLEKALTTQDAATKALAQANDLLTQIHSAIDNDNVVIANIEAQIAAQHTGKTAFGGWPQNGPDLVQFKSYETKVGPPMLGYRSSGGEGQLDNPFLLPNTLVAAKAGHLVSLQFQPKTGKGSPRTGVPYKDITAGKHDATILAGMKQFLTLPPPPAGFHYPFECHSEFDVQKPNTSQPPIGPAQDYAPFVMHLDKLARQAGVRQLLDFICGSGAYRFWAGNWGAWITPALLSSGVVDTLGVDFYAKDKNGYVSPTEGTKYIIQVAKQVKLPYCVQETGCDEKPGAPTFKASWYDEWGTVMKANPAKFLFFNLNLGGYVIDSSPQALASFKKLLHSGLFA